MKKNTKMIKIDLTDAESPVEVIAKFVDAKIDNQIPIESWEMKTYCDWNYHAGFLDGVESITNMLSLVFIADSDQICDMINAMKPKKQNIFKRAWNWIKSKIKK